MGEPQQRPAAPLGIPGDRVLGAGRSHRVALHPACRSHAEHPLRPVPAGPLAGRVPRAHSQQVPGMIRFRLEGTRLGPGTSQSNLRAIAVDVALPPLFTERKTAWKPAAYREKSRAVSSDRSRSIAVNWDGMSGGAQVVVDVASVLPSCWEHLPIVGATPRASTCSLKVITGAQS